MHTCPFCGHECDCGGDIDDAVVSHAPVNCQCEVCAEEDEMRREDNMFDQDDYWPEDDHDYDYAD